MRGWESARAFAAAGHAVTVAALVSKPHVRDGIQVLPYSRRRVLPEAFRSDVIHAPLLPPYAMAMPTLRRCLRITDLYDPLDLELASRAGRDARRELSQHLEARRMQLRWSDLIISANEPQLARVRRDLEGVRRSRATPELMLIPMGVPDPPPREDGRPIRERIPAIGATDPVVLWWGTIWRWFDARTAIEAIAVLAARRPDLRLVFSGGRAPMSEAERLTNVTEEARELARAKGLLDRNVFFLDEWVPYEDRHRYLQDADIGLTLHANGPEVSLAARFRYTDYIWAGLPSVLAAGDEGSAQMGAAGAATLVPPKDPAATAAALEALVVDPDARHRAGAACLALAERCRWSELLAPMVARVEEMAPAGRSPAQAARITAAASRYYAQRAFDRCLAALPE